MESTPSTNLDVTHKIEGELYGFGLRIQYQDALWIVVPAGEAVFPGAAVIEDLWRLFHVTAAQRCRAALLAIATKIIELPSS